MAAFKNTLPPQEYLKQCFDYEPDNGVLRWRARPFSHFSVSRWRDGFNTRYTGTVAGAPSSRGYIFVSVDGRLYGVHRVIWKLMTGEDPLVVDHINRNPADNRWVNLRSVTPTESNFNRKDQSHSTGVRGVCCVERNHRLWYIANFCVHRKRLRLGWFKSFDEAVAARLRAEADHSHLFNLPKP